jgi:hypothetical protein
MDENKMVIPNPDLDLNKCDCDRKSLVYINIPTAQKITTAVCTVIGGTMFSYFLHVSFLKNGQFLIA